MRSLRFTQDCLPYAAGEQAGFNDVLAARLLRRKVAVEVEPEPVAEVEPEPVDLFTAPEPRRKPRR